MKTLLVKVQRLASQWTAMFGVRNKCLFSLILLAGLLSNNAYAAIDWGGNGDPIIVKRSDVFYIVLDGDDAANYQGVNSSNTTNCQLGGVSSDSGSMIVIPIQTLNSRNQSCTITINFKVGASEKQNYMTNNTRGSTSTGKIIWTNYPNEQREGDTDSIQAVAYSGRTKQINNISYSSTSTANCNVNPSSTKGASIVTALKRNTTCGVRASYSNYTAITAQWPIRAPLTATRIDFTTVPAASVSAPSGSMGLVAKEFVGVSSTSTNRVPSYEVLTPSICHFSAGNVSFVGDDAASCEVRAYTESDNTYTATENTLVIERLTPFFDWLSTPKVGSLNSEVVAKGTYGETGQTITYSTSTPDYCSVDKTTGEVIFDGGGDCQIIATAAAKNLYAKANSAPKDVNRVTPELSWVNEPTNLSFAVKAKVEYEGNETGQTVYYETEDINICTIQGGTLTIKKEGICNINAYVKEEGAFLAAGPLSASLSMQAQSISHTVWPSRIIEGNEFYLEAVRTDGPDTPININVVSGPCTKKSEETLSDDSKKATFKAGAGNCTVKVTSNGAGVYLAYDSGPILVEIEKLIQEQGISYSPNPFGVYVFGQIAQTSADTIPAGGEVSIEVNSDSCAIFQDEGDDTLPVGQAEISLLKAGTCVVTYKAPERITEDEGIKYLEAIRNVSFIVDRWSQKIVVDLTPPANKKANTDFVVRAHNENTTYFEGIDDLGFTPQLDAVEIVVGAGSACFVKESGVDDADDADGVTFKQAWAKIQMAPAGQNCIIYFKQAGNANFKAASNVSYVVALTQELEDDDISQFWTHYELFQTASGQAITSAPMVARDGNVKASAPNLMVIFGTGMYHQIADLSDDEKDKPQSIYGVHDRGVDGRKRTDLVQRILSESSVTVDGVSQRNRKISGVDINWGQKYGWYFDLLGGQSGTTKEGERSVFRPFLSNQLFVFNTVIPISGRCDGATQGWTMLVDWATGKAPGFPTYDADLVNGIDDGDKGFVGYFNEVAGSELGRSGDNIFDSSGSEARVRSVTFGELYDGVQIGWEEKRPFGVLNRGN